MNKEITKQKHSQTPVWKRGILIFVFFPFLLTVFYLYFLSSDMFEVQSTFIIKQNQQENSSPKFELGTLFSINTTSKEDAYLIREYIHSTNMLQLLDQELKLREHYVSPKFDYVRRLDPQGSKEDFLQYYRKMISVVIDPESTIVSLTARAFTPEVARQTVQLILQHGELFINEISKKLADEQVNFVREEVTRVEAQLRKAKDGILAFQNRKTLVDPESNIKSRIEIIGELESEITQKEAALKEMKRILRNDTFQISQLQNQIRALKDQVAEEMRELTGSPDISLNQVMSEYHNLSLDLEFAENTYKSAIASLETSRLEASRKLKRMVMISNSGLPEEPAYPERVYSSLTALVVLLLVYGIGKLLIATINDHRE